MISFRFTALLLVIGLLLAPLACAEDNVLRQGDIVIHYNALPSSQLSAAIARQYGITRSANRALLNIAIKRQHADDSTQSIDAQAEGSATNSVGQRQALRLRRVQEADAIYYLAEARITPRDTLDFKLTITPDGSKTPIQLEFQQEFFPDH